MFYLVIGLLCFGGFGSKVFDKGFVIGDFFLVFVDLCFLLVVKL